MSFKEVRSFTETMKCLGYPRMISLNNFRKPNFELVADCLYWLVQRFYPECSISDDISTESDRVKFLQSIAQITLTKARMKLNLKKLYAADSSAVKELLKLAELLYKATQTAGSTDEGPFEIADLASASKLCDVAAAAAAAAEVARCGVALHDGLLAEGQQLRESRARALAAAYDTSMVEAGIHETLTGLSEALNSLTIKLSELSSTELQLAARLEKRRSELERAEKRLATLAGVRPAYMEEYEALTGQLQVLWLHYLERFRNLQYLEAQLQSYHKAEQTEADAAERRRKKMQRRLAEEEMRILRGEAAVNESNVGRGTIASCNASSSGSDADDDNNFVNDTQDVGGLRGPGGSAGRRGLRQPQFLKQQRQQQQQQAGAAGKVVGSLAAGGDWDEDDSIEDDTDSDAGELSRIGSEASGGSAGMGAAGDYGAAIGMDDGSDAEGIGAPRSEDSGF